MKANNKCHIKFCFSVCVPFSFVVCVVLLVLACVCELWMWVRDLWSFFFFFAQSFPFRFPSYLAFPLMAKRERLRGREQQRHLAQWGKNTEGEGKTGPKENNQPKRQHMSIFA